MNNILTVFLQEYSKRIHSTIFWAITAIVALLILGMTFSPVLLDWIRSNSPTRIAVVGGNEQLLSQLQSMLPEKLPDGKPAFEIKQVKDFKEAARELEAGKYKGILTVERSSPAQPAFTYYSSRPGSEAGRLRAALNRIAVQERLSALGLKADQVSEVFRPVPMEVKPTGKKSGALPVLSTNILFLLLYFAVATYGTMVMSSIVQEKSTRITEMLITSIRPFEHMAGKILGIGALGITQFLVWAAAAIGALLIDRLLSKNLDVTLTTLPISTLLLFALFFILGFLLYAAINAGLGSLVSRQEDANYLSIPMVLLLLIALYLAIFAVGNPDNRVIAVASYIPFFSPIVMFTRIVLGSAGILEGAISVGLLVISVVFAFWMAARLYRAGVLLYGNRPSIIQILRLIGQG